MEHWNGWAGGAEKSRRAGVRARWSAGRLAPGRFAQQPLGGWLTLLPATAGQGACFRLEIASAQGLPGFLEGEGRVTTRGARADPCEGLFDIAPAYTRGRGVVASRSNGLPRLARVISSTIIES